MQTWRILLLFLLLLFAVVVRATILKTIAWLFFTKQDKTNYEIIISKGSQFAICMSITNQPPPAWNIHTCLSRNEYSHYIYLYINYSEVWRMTLVWWHTENWSSNLVQLSVLSSIVLELISNDSMRAMRATGKILNKGSLVTIVHFSTFDRHDDSKNAIAF